ncbi:Stealth CR1 domain-containing protein [Cellvibrio sp. UBA7661]|uniref:Stealth CR1 domain-containing protein n=1 Tax=Cellvibrio sp. UBA7661 TaxID=1946311 RepID=UPI002F35B4DB
MNTTFDREPIDAVITWVDGADPHHKAKLDDYLNSIGSVRPQAANPARFSSVGEIEYCVVSLLRFAPWIRTIFIVTDQQQPDFIAKLDGTPYESRVKIIDHSVIFSGYEQYLPTFNSMSISSMLWRVPDLAEQFLFLNDDFALIRPVEPSVFFRGGKVVLHGEWRAQTGKRFAKKISRFFKMLRGQEQNKADARVRFIGVQENAAQMLGYTEKVFELEHNPHPWKRSSWKTYFSDHPAALDKNLSFRLRSAEQFVPEGFSAHYEIKMGNAIVDKTAKTLQLKPADQALVRIKAKLAQAERDDSFVFVCIQSLENAPTQQKELILNWLNVKVGLLNELLINKFYTK